MRVAIIHDWLVTYAGAERVLEQMLECFPEAELFSLVDFLPPDQRGFIHNKPVTTTFIQSLPMAKTRYRSYLPLMPLAMEQLDLSDYDLVISNSHAVAKGVITGPDQLHICMCHAPIRYAWDLQHQYLRESSLQTGVKGLFAKAVLHRIRNWDYRTSNGVDVFFASSEFTRRRVWKVYRRESTIVFPPVDTRAFVQRDEKDDFYFTASRMVPYKKIDLIVEAFAAMPSRKLVVIGTGPDWRKIEALAAPNVTLLGYQDHATLQDHMQRAKAFVFAAKEDFGIVPLEAQACGTPVIAFGEGGALETVRGLDESDPTGVFFDRQSVSSLVGAVERFEERVAKLTPAACRKNAERFSNETFRSTFKAAVTGAFSSWKQARTAQAART